MTATTHPRLIAAILLLMLLIPGVCAGHGVLGERFFPESIVVDDPFPADEMDLLSFSGRKDNKNLTDSFGSEISKRLTPDLSLAIGGAYDVARPNGGSQTMYGFENLDLELKYSVIQMPEHEFIASAGVIYGIGGTGAAGVGSSPRPTVMPQMLFGWGMGDLPDSLKYFKPLAVTGQLGVASTIGGGAPSTLNYGLVVEYSLLYLQSFVKDVGIPWPMSRLFPVAEFNVETPLGGPGAARTQALANPGILWAGEFYEIGVEAAIPLNGATGHSVGVQALVHLFLDDIFPFTYGRPFFGAGPLRR